MEHIKNRIIRVATTKLLINSDDMYGYMLCIKKNASNDTVKTAKKQLEIITTAASPIAIYSYFPIEIHEDDIHFPFATVVSSSLARHMQGCSGAIIFAATAGAECDIMIRRATARNELDGIAAHAAGAVVAESLCDFVEKNLNDICKSYGKTSLPRFSPGYADLPLSFQRDIFTNLDCEKIGLTLTDACLMIPSKSVSAICGIS